MEESRSNGKVRAGWLLSCMEWQYKDAEWSMELHSACNELKKTRFSVSETFRKLGG